MTPDLIQFLQTSLEMATKSADVLIKELLNYIMIIAILKTVTIAAISAFLYKVVTQAVIWCRTKANESASPDRKSVNTIWAGVFSSIRAAILVAAIFMAFQSSKDALKILVAPNIYLIETGLKLLKDNKPVD